MGSGMSDLVVKANPFKIDPICESEVGTMEAILGIAAAPHTPRPLGKLMLRVVRNDSII